MGDVNARGGPQQIPRPPAWTPGRPPAWGDAASTELLTAARVREVFGGRRGDPSPVAVHGASPSAVLIPLYESDGRLWVVLTRRAWDLRTHKGEVSFPGGRADPGETYAQTATREANEEIALDPSVVDVVGEMDHLTTVTRRAYIVPVVALLDGLPAVTPHPGEVDAVLHVPLDELCLPEVFHEEQWGMGPTSRPLYFFDLVGDTIWGATASMLRLLLVMLLGLHPGEPHEYDAARGLGPWEGIPPGIADDVV